MANEREVVLAELTREARRIGREIGRLIVQAYELRVKEDDLGAALRLASSLAVLEVEKGGIHTSIMLSLASEIMRAVTDRLEEITRREEEAARKQEEAKILQELETQER